MRIHTTPISGILLIEPTVFGDDRGYFFESFSREALANQGLYAHFVQDNESLSHKGVLRGLHWQAPPFEQAKLVRVVTGAVYDVAVDIRKGSPTYGKHFGIRLDADNHLMMYIPAGFAHGFTTLEDNTRFLYKCTHYYNKASEGAVNVKDPDLNIDWGIENPMLSPKDEIAQSFKSLESPFDYVG
jgi:dTDP-4-dehydrorhamnose 3,5-epimerase